MHVNICRRPDIPNSEYFPCRSNTFAIDFFNVQVSGVVPGEVYYLLSVPFKYIFILRASG